MGMPVILDPLIIIFILIVASNASLKITTKFVLLMLTFLSCPRVAMTIKSKK